MGIYVHFIVLIASLTQKETWPFFLPPNVGSVNVSRKIALVSKEYACAV